MTRSQDNGRLALAKEGENLAARVLERAGYEIVARNVRTRWGEIDLLARLDATWVFVEVKTRRGGRYGLGAEAVTYHKQQKLIRMAQIVLARVGGLEDPVRFDVVEVTYTGGSPSVRHLENAFGA